MLVKRLLKYTKPVLVIPGNHDTRKAGAGWFYRFFGPNYFSFSAGNNLFLMLDTSNKRELSNTMLKWLINTLQNRQSKDGVKLAFMHIPPFDPRKGDMTIGHSLSNPKDSLKLLKILKKFHVNAIFCSHIHGFFTGSWMGIPFYISGGGGYDRLKGYNSHYLKVTLKNNHIWVQKIVVRTPPADDTKDKLLASFFIPTLIIFDRYWLFLTVMAILVILLL